MICLLVLTQYTNVTDNRTDGQTLHDDRNHRMLLLGA